MGQTSASMPTAPVIAMTGPSGDTMPMVVHASCVALGRHGVLLVGPSGAGKSDLALRLLDRGFRLVADDRVEVRVRGGVLSAVPPRAALAALSALSPGRGSECAMLEVRGLGVFEVRRGRPAQVSLVVSLVVSLAGGRAVPRLPAPSLWHGVPMVTLDAAAASAAQAVHWALDATRGRRRQRVGAFAP